MTLSPTAYLNYNSVISCRWFYCDLIPLNIIVDKYIFFYISCLPDVLPICTPISFSFHIYYSFYLDCRNQEKFKHFISTISSLTANKLNPDPKQWIAQAKSESNPVSFWPRRAATGRPRGLLCPPWGAAAGQEDRGEAGQRGGNPGRRVRPGPGQAGLHRGAGEASSALRDLLPNLSYGLCVHCTEDFGFEFPQMSLYAIFRKSIQSFEVDEVEVEADHAGAFVAWPVYKHCSLANNQT